MENWVIRTLGSSVGKKQLMAVTGLGFIGFLTMHLIGNLTIYMGADAFNSYAEHLHALGPLVLVSEMGLLLLLCVHVTTGSLLFYENWQARPQRYVSKKWAGGRTVFSATMPYTGFLMLVFVVVHLITFKFADIGQPVFEIASGVFANMCYVFFYTFSMIVVAFHVKHGLWSAFQTFGANHPKYMPAVQGLSILFGLAVAAGFGFLPTVFLIMA